MPVPEDQFAADSGDADLLLQMAGGEEGGEGEGGGPGGSEVANVDPAIIAEARRQGWRPKEEFKGDPATWVDPETFVERGKHFSATLQKKVSSLEQTLAEQRQTMMQFQTFHKEAMERKDRELADTIRQLRRRKVEATAEGEHQEVLDIEDRLETLNAERQELKKQKEDPVKTPAADPDAENPVLQSWVSDGNEWFRDNPRMRAYAIAVGEELRASGNTKRDREFLEDVAAEMRKSFPQQFQSARSRPGAVESGAVGSSTPQGKTERDLPAEDQLLMRKFVREGLMTKEDFLKNYSW